MQNGTSGSSQPGGQVVCLPPVEQATHVAYRAASVCQALSDAQKREIYDRYGEDGLKNGFGGGGGAPGGGGMRFRTPEDIFAEVKSCVDSHLI